MMSAGNTRSTESGLKNISAMPAIDYAIIDNEVADDGAGTVGAVGDIFTRQSKSTVAGDALGGTAAVATDVTDAAVITLVVLVLAGGEGEAGGEV
jgi:hypothetical protein